VRGDKPRVLLIDGSVEEHGQDDRGRAINGHRHRGRGGAEVESVVQRTHVFEIADRHPGVADLAVDVRSLVRVPAVQRHGIEGGGQAMRRHAFRHTLEPTIGAEGIAFASEHTGRVLTFAFEREHARREGKVARQVFAAQKAQQVAVAQEAGQGHFRDCIAGQGFMAKLGAQFAIPDMGDEGIAGVSRGQGGPLSEKALAVSIQTGRNAICSRLPGRVVPEVLWQQGVRLTQCLSLLGKFRLARGGLVVMAHRVGNFREVAHPLGRYTGAAITRCFDCHRTQLAELQTQSVSDQ